MHSESKRYDFERLYIDCQPRLTAYALRFVNNPIEAQDLVHDCFMALWDRQAPLDPEEARMLLFAMTRNRLARLCSPDTIAYVQCTDTQDEHYEALHQMEEQLKTFRTLNGNPYRLLALPMVDKIEEEGERLPATYANFLIMNDAVLYPTYRQPENDQRAKEVLQEAFPEYEIVGIDCRALIKQHGSLHCVTMQYPAGVLK